MKSSVVYIPFEHGNTEKVARPIAEAMGAELKVPKDDALGTLSDYQMIGVASGIFKGKFRVGLEKFVNDLPPSRSNAFVFSTSGYGTDQYHDEIGKTLEGKGYRVVGDFACKGWDTYGPFKLTGGINKKRPNEDDLMAAKGFGKTLLTKNIN